MRLPHLALATAAALSSLACGNNATETNRAGNANAARTNAAAPQTAASPATPAPTPDELAVARGIYAQQCQRCHQPNGTGGVFEEQGLKPLKVPSLREGSAVRHTDEQLTRRITNGDDGMPAFKNKLSPEQIGQLVALIRRDFQAQAGAPSAPAANANQPASLR